MSSTFATVIRRPENVIVITLQGNPTKLEFELQFLSILDALLDNASPFKIVVDTDLVTGIAMPIAWQMVRWMKANRARLQQYLKCTGVIITNDTVKSMMDFVIRIQPPAAPMRLVSSNQDAFNFIESIV